MGGSNRNGDSLGLQQSVAPEEQQFFTCRLAATERTVGYRSNPEPERIAVAPAAGQEKGEWIGVVWDIGLGKIDDLGVRGG